jgi:uncharacterized protein (TIRG00374 family)
MTFRILRTAAGLLILFLLAYFGRIDLSALESALSHPALLAFAASLMLLAIPISALRWWLLTSALGFPMNYAWSLRTTFTGQFFSMFLPGAIGGDLIRVTLARRAARRGLAQLTFSVLMDRLSGLAGLVLLGFCALPTMPERFHQPAYLVPWAIGCATILGGFVVAVVWGHLIAGLLGRLPDPIGPRLSFSAREVLAALRTYADRWLTLVWTLAISIINFLMIFAALASLGAAMTFNSLSPAGYVIAGVWASIVNTIPLTPGGLGLGEAAFAQIAVMLESAPSGASYANAFLAMRILAIMVSALGLLPYLAQRGDLLGAPPTNSDAPVPSDAHKGQ